MALSTIPINEDKLVTEIGDIDGEKILKHFEPYFNCSVAKDFGGVAVQHRENIPSPWKWVDGLRDIGLYTSYYNKDSTIQDVGLEDFCVINEVFRNTVLEDIINQYNLVSTRLLWKTSERCYKVHVDPMVSFHIPLITDEHNFFYFPRYKRGFTLEKNEIYIVDTRENHTFVNASHWGLKRIHLMASLADSLDYTRDENNVLILDRDNYKFY